MDEANSGYNFIFNPDKERVQNADVKSIITGSVDSIDIVGGGTGYKVNDGVIFDNALTGGVGAAAKVSSLSGKIVNQVSVATSSIDAIEITPNQGSEFIAFSNSPHLFLANDKIGLSGFNTSVNNLYGSYSIGVKSEFYVLNVGVGTSTGLFLK